MCGIVGYVGHRDAVSYLLPGLRRLEYRGYDSAGIATIHGTSLDVRKTTGKIALAHLNEFPDYYTRLRKMEAEAEGDGG